jgi:hypothetical protein
VVLLALSPGGFVAPAVCARADVRLLPLSQPEALADALLRLWAETR